MFPTVVYSVRCTQHAVASNSSLLPLPLVRFQEVYRENVFARARTSCVFFPRFYAISEISRKIGIKSDFFLWVEKSDIKLNWHKNCGIK